ncbi:MAG TPA: amidase domain-containing protein [Clostridiales bacterium]|nr:amidase domain-containing protein [Clostridiales bacterium]
MRKILYNRSAALEYAKKWAYSRNPKYYDFSNLGGDCTNFISQCVFAGINVMNFTPITGWYYLSAGNRTASWTAAEYFFKFMINNKGAGPQAAQINQSQIIEGDIIQLSFKDNVFTHSLFVVATIPEITVATHTFDSYDRPLRSYIFDKIRFIKITGGAKY